MLYPTQYLMTQALYRALTSVHPWERVVEIRSIKKIYDIRSYIYDDTASTHFMQSIDTAMVYAVCAGLVNHS